MSEIPEAVRRAMEARGVDIAAVEEALAGDPIPPDERAVEEQMAELGDWRSALPDEPEPVEKQPEPTLFDESADLSETERAMITGRYFGGEPTATERESGTDVELDRAGPLRPGSLAHRILAQYEDGTRLTAYEASYRLANDWHAKRRESTRLLERGFLVKQGTKPNEAPSGRPHVDAFVITEAGRAELRRLA